MKVRFTKSGFPYDDNRGMSYSSIEEMDAGRGVCLSDLTVGKVYDVVSIEIGGAYRIVDDSEWDYLYSPEVFEIVEALPEPPILTEEEVERGEGDKYVVVKHEIDEDNLIFPRGMTIEDWREGKCVGYDRPEGYVEYPDMDIEDAIEVAYAKAGKQELAFA